MTTVFVFFVVFMIRLICQPGKFYIPKVTVTKSSDGGNMYKAHLPPVSTRQNIYLKYEISIKPKNKFGLNCGKALPVTLEIPQKEELEVFVSKCTGKYIPDRFNVGEIWLLASTCCPTTIILKCHCVKNEDITHTFKFKIEDGALNLIHFESDTVEYVKCKY
jgi:hypothetical protein